MSDSRRVDDLTLDELETLLAQRQRIERARLERGRGPGRDERHFAMPDSELPGLRAPRQKRPRSLHDRLLLVVEICAVVALVAIAVGTLLNLDLLNEQVKQSVTAGPPSGAAAADEELPASPFPPAGYITELPGSSFPPEPAPPALGLRLASVAALPAPTPGPRSPTRIVIPAIKIDWPVVEGDDWESLKQGVGHRPGTVNPGERGNMVISGHNDVYGEPFRDLEIIKVGEEVLVYAGRNAFRYIIKAKRVVPPTDLSPLSPSKTPILTMITCTPYRVDTMRLIVTAELVP